MRQNMALDWSELEVVERWHQLFNGTLFSQRFVDGDTLSNVLKKDIEKWRKRLADISWFMRIINETIARQASAENQCTGSFSVIAPALLYLLCT